MLPLTRRWAVSLAMAVGMIGAVITLAAANDKNASAKTAAVSSAAAVAAQNELKPPRQEAKPAKGRRDALPADLLEGFDPLQYKQAGQYLASDLENNRVAVLSLDVGLQEKLKKLLAQYKVPYAAVAAIEPSTGRVLAYVSHSSADRRAGDLVLDPSPPAASVFKVITAAALLDQGVEPTRRVCYGGGLRRLRLADITDDLKRDHYCVTLEEALAGSVNAVFAKLADRLLDSKTLERYASAFGFGRALPFDVRVKPSPVEIPQDRLEFARAAAGFWHAHMSPFHGALVAAAIANSGTMPRAYMIERVVDATGNTIKQHVAGESSQVIPASTANTLARMMRLTTTKGTAFKAFHDERGRAFLPGTGVAGKTGTLTSQEPYRAYSWWVGFAPADNPVIALAVLVVNKPVWRIKAGYVARETLRYYLRKKREDKEAPVASAPVAREAPVAKVAPAVKGG